MKTNYGYRVAEFYQIYFYEKNSSFFEQIIYSADTRFYSDIPADRADKDVIVKVYSTDHNFIGVQTKTKVAELNIPVRFNILRLQVIISNI